MCRVADGGRRSESGVAEVSDGASVEVRCLPAWTRRMSDVGADVRRESSWRRVDIVVSEGTFRGMAFCCNVSSSTLCYLVGLGDVLSPDSSLTKIWKLSIAGDEDVDVEEAFEEEREVRMLGDKGRGLLDKYVARDSEYRSRYKGDKVGK